MAETRTLAFTPHSDIEQILQEAQHRWLRPVEICEVLRNYHKFYIAPEPPNKPPNGSLFLFDRKVLRYFRKDSYNWRKKKDGKTVKEAHEKLKVGSIDVLHCYYAHGEDNENFQRRSYWMLEEELMHIVLVHYREVKGNRANYFQPSQDGATAQIAHADSPSFSMSTTLSQLPSQATDLECPNSTQLSECEDADSDNFQQNSRYNPFPEIQQYGPWVNVNLRNACGPAPAQNDQFTQVGMNRLVNESDGGITFPVTKTETDMASWHEILERCTKGFHEPSINKIVGSTWANDKEESPDQNIMALRNFLNGDLFAAKVDGTTILGTSVWQLDDDEVGSIIPSNTIIPNIKATQGNLMSQPSEQSPIDCQDLKKFDSFSRWMSKELGVVHDSQIMPESGLYWSTLENESIIAESSLCYQEQLDTYVMAPSLSHDQLFSIIDFSPNWAYTELETKVLIEGKFLMNNNDVRKHKWSCMFGEIEVPAYILADGTLCCHAPPHKPGRIPFYVTCSNRLACSEIQDFEYKVNEMLQWGSTDSYGGKTYDANLLFRLEKLLILESVDHSNTDCYQINEGHHTNCTICSMMMEIDADLLNLFKNINDEDLSHVTVKNLVLDDPLKGKLHAWLLHKVGEDGKGPNVLDEKGQGVLHLAAALGYDWAIKPTIAAGVNINFRDVHGWTALHWAAFCGRERMVVTLIAFDASSGALTDPTPEFPSGRSPADLASQNGHKGIAGFLAESSLINHLREITLKDSEGSNLSASGLLGSNHVAETNRSHLAYGENQSSLKDSLSAVRSATEAAARIYQVFRVQSFHRKKLINYGNDRCGISDESVVSLISARSKKPGHHDMPVHTAAIKIQNKFRGWKGRKEFLTIRQQIVKIQAHVRGHQVRKQYRKILWSVGILEKVILRWRRKGIGLRGFRSEGILRGQRNQCQFVKEDDYDFLQEGRKQVETRLEKALDRVRSMVQYPEARDQYRRLLTVLGELQESKFLQPEAPNEIVESEEVDLMMELEGLLGDDTIMPPVM